MWDDGRQNPRKAEHAPMELMAVTLFPWPRSQFVPGIEGNVCEGGSHEMCLDDLIDILDVFTFSGIFWGGWMSMGCAVWLSKYTQPIKMGVAVTMVILDNSRTL